ncbi:hypothetical protein ACFQ1Q_09145 [Winogradskyella litorisediminis]|uniref:Uncharacterized protein n=1 Tax=Winogradskyella litorisediminis TaxID=1156618 RepID=A0ABW3N6U7_9FLAO
MEPNDKKFEAFVDKLMANDTLEKPSADFTNSVLHQLNITSKPIVYKPLISKWVWCSIALVFAAVVVYAFLDDSKSTSKLSELMNLSQFNFNPLKDVEFNLSQTLVYALITTMVMIGFQVSILKNYINKRLQF